MKFRSFILMFLICIGAFLPKGKTCNSGTNSDNFVWRWWITSGWWKKYCIGSNIQFSANDHITCDIPGQDYIIFTPKHHMLATSNTTVAHSFGYDTTARVLEEDWINGPFRLSEFFGNETCWVQTPTQGRPDAIERAKLAADKFQGVKTHYNLFTCNCEHWVRFWLYNSAYSRQSFRYASEYCELWRIFVGHPTYFSKL